MALDIATMSNPLLGPLQLSDHREFWFQNYSALMITDSAMYRNTHYHCEHGPDSVERLDQDFAVATIQSTVAALAELAEIQ
jgi:hypothetical protein